MIALSKPQIKAKQIGYEKLVGRFSVFIQNLWRELAYVPRWGIFRRNRDQSVAEHSYYVSVYAGQIAEMVKWKGDAAMLLKAALIHDLFEGRSGDIPAPFKRQMGIDEKHLEAEWKYFHDNFRDQLPVLAALRGDPQIAAIVRVADRLEGCIFLATEWMSGNRYAGRMYSPGSPARDMVMSLGRAWIQLRDELHMNMDLAAVCYSNLMHAIQEAEEQRPQILMAHSEQTAEMVAAE